MTPPPALAPQSVSPRGGRYRKQLGQKNERCYSSTGYGFGSNRKLSMVSRRAPASRGLGMNALAFSGSLKTLPAEITITGIS